MTVSSLLPLTSFFLPAMAGGREDAGLERLDIRLMAALAKCLWTLDGRRKMSGCVCGARRLTFLLGVSAVRLKQSTSLLRLCCLTSMLIYPHLRRVIVCRLADAPPLNSPSNPHRK